ncbi:MAG: Lrp/AsnC ligand binding domain-containing protein [Chloroflexi bacterium]|nr:Lrp/AsnC ligand binding domain-containing protein [Chloroflexota bacterium]MCI0807775.1 Lrp/AsnC ligand binding domain-containing protein [Chloroflexota bacterium]
MRQNRIARLVNSRRRDHLAPRAYILIETAVGKTNEVADALKNMPLMKAVDTVTGPFDIIAIAEADDLPGIGDLITDGMHRVPGIVKTVTCLSVGS